MGGKSTALTLPAAQEKIQILHRLKTENIIRSYNCVIARPHQGRYAGCR